MLAGGRSTALAWTVWRENAPTSCFSGTSQHWLIETATGPVSKGKWQLCGEEREFSNSTDFRSTWAPLNQQSQKAPQPEEAGDGE